MQYTEAIRQGCRKDKRRAVRKRAATLVVDKGEVFLKRKGRQVEVVTTVEDQRRILESCHSAFEPLFRSTISLHLPNYAKKKSCKSESLIHPTFVLLLSYA